MEEAGPLRSASAIHCVGSSVKTDNKRHKLGHLALCLVIVGALGALAELWWTSSRAAINFLPGMGRLSGLSIQPSKKRARILILNCPRHLRIPSCSTPFRQKLCCVSPDSTATRFRWTERHPESRCGPVQAGNSPMYSTWLGNCDRGPTRIEVTVFNSNGPPALWLSLNVGPLQVNSGEDLAGFLCRRELGAPRFQLPAPKPMTASSCSYGLPPPWAGLGMRWPTLLGFALLSAVGCWLLRKTNLSSSTSSNLPLPDGNGEKDGLVSRIHPRRRVGRVMAGPVRQ